MLGVQLDSLAGVFEGWKVIISVKGEGLGGCDSIKSSSTEWAPEWEAEELLKSGDADLECGCVSKVQFEWGGRPGSVSETEEEATAPKQTEAKLVSVRTSLQDRAFRVTAEVSEEREIRFNSVWDSKNTVALIDGWMTSMSSGSEFPCSDRGQNGSSTCRNTRVILLHTRYEGGQTQTPIQRTRASRKPREKHLATLILPQQDQSRQVMFVTCNQSQ